MSTDPHVTELIYRVSSAGHTEYKNPPPISVSFPEMEVSIAGDQATVTPLIHFPDTSSARSFVEPYLEAWALMSGEAQFRFDYSNARLIDRAAPERGPVSPTEFTTSAPTVVMTADRYPTPRTEIAITPQVEAMLHAYRRFRDGGANVGHLAYFCLTSVESAFPGKGSQSREAAAKALAIEPAVLSKLGELSSERGDARTGRKFRVGRDAHTHAEQDWLHKAVRELIDRMARYARDRDCGMEPLRMNDLPTL